jgi:hypothetical protein
MFKNRWKGMLWIKKGGLERDGYQSGYEDGKFCSLKRRK